MAQNTKNFNPRLARRKMVGGIYYVVFLAAVMVSIVSLFVLLTQTAIQGLPWLDFDFLTNYMSRKPELAGSLQSFSRRCSQYPSAWEPRSTSKSTLRRTGSPS